MSELEVPFVPDQKAFDEFLTHHPELGEYQNNSDAPRELGRMAVEPFGQALETTYRPSGSNEIARASVKTTYPPGLPSDTEYYD